MTYNMTQLQESRTIFQLVSYANDMTSGVLVMGLCIALFFILLMMNMAKTEFIKSMLISSWIVFVISAFFAYAKLVSLYFPLGFLIMGALSTLYIVATGN